MVIVHFHNITALPLAIPPPPPTHTHISSNHLAYNLDIVNPFAMINPISDKMLHLHCTRFFFQLPVNPKLERLFQNLENGLSIEHNRCVSAAML